MAGHGAPSSSEPIIYIDRSDIREGAVDELKAGVQRLVDFIRAREPQLMMYGFYIDNEAGQMTVLAVHPDSASSSTWKSAARHTRSNTVIRIWLGEMRGGPKWSIGRTAS